MRLPICRQSKLGRRHFFRVRLVGAAFVAVMLSGSADGRTSVGRSTNASASAGDPFVARLWRSPGRVASRDVFWGAGARVRQPRPPFWFREEDASGTQPKVVVSDARDVVWDVKFGEEVHAEIAANRMAWALGYLTEEVYFVRRGQIAGVADLKRSARFIAADGRFEDARFKRRDPRLAPTDAAWSFHDNPFMSRRELSGLKILMTLINNWDIEGSRNNRVFAVSAPEGHTERWYMVADLGGSFGKMGGRLSDHSKWNLQAFRSDDFSTRVGNGKLVLDYDGIESGWDEVPLEHARWFAQLASQLTYQQLRAAFAAAGASPDETDGFSRALHDRIATLRASVDVKQMSQR